MPRYYCPKCFSDFAEDVNICPKCGLDIDEFYDTRDFIDKLIVALNHPEPSTPVRAAWLLGKIKEQRAVRPLIDLIKSTDDVFIARTAVIAIGEIGTDEAIGFLASITDYPSNIVRNEIINQVEKSKTKPVE